MSAAAVDRALAVLVVALAATGLLTLRAGDPAEDWLFLVHGVLGGALVLTIGLKLRHSVPRAVAARRFARLALGLTVSFIAIAALAGGYLWVASAQIAWIDVGGLGRWTILTLHAWAGLVLVPLVVVHVLPRRWRLLRPNRPRTGAGGPGTSRLLTRRTVLAGGAMAVAGLGLWGVTSALDLLAGGSRRFTGSRWLPPGSTPIATTFFGEPVPDVDEPSWRLSVDGAVDRPLRLDLPGLRALGDQEMSAVLDCTSGWAVEATWRGVPLSSVLDAAGISSSARQVEIRSVTGWATSLDLPNAREALLAWSIAGAPLPVANGAPLRLVLPNHRGLDWVKWVGSIRVD